MTPQQRIKAAIQGQEIDRVPWCPFLAYWWESQPDDRQKEGQIAFYREIGADALLRGLTCAFSNSDVIGLNEKNYNVHDDLPGCTIRRGSGGDERFIEYDTPVGKLVVAQTYSSAGNTWFVTKHPVREKEDYKTLQFIVSRMKLAACYGPLNTEIEELGKDGLSVPLICPFKKTPFQILIEHFVGTEKLMYDLNDFPELVEETIAVMSERALQAVRISVESRAEAFITWEDSSTTNVSPALYEKYIAPDLDRWADILHRSGKVLIHHACGHIKDLLPIMSRGKADAIESLTPPPTGNIEAWDARKVLRDRTTIIGGMDPLLFTTLRGAEFDDYVNRLLDMMDGGRFILANSDSCPPGVEDWKFARVSQIVQQRRKG